MSKKKSYAASLEEDFSHKEFLKKFGFNKNKKKIQKKSINMVNIQETYNDKNALGKLVSNSIFNDGIFPNLSLREITIKQSAFVFADLYNCDFSNSTLDGCDFSFANLQNCNFANAIMRNCIFRHVNIANANFSDTETTFCDFTGAYVKYR